MGHRLSKIVTRTGDAGDTGLATGARVAKTSLRVEAMGDVDELNCLIGLLLVQGVPDLLHERLTRIQHELFNLGGELALPGHVLIQDEDVLRLESELAQMNETLPPLKEFILPGGSAGCAQAQLARAVARRAERTLWRLHADEPLAANPTRYLNRLSDYLFVTARVLAREAGGTEVGWSRS